MNRLRHFGWESNLQTGDRGLTKWGVVSIVFGVCVYLGFLLSSVFFSHKPPMVEVQISDPLFSREAHDGEIYYFAEYTIEIATSTGIEFGDSFVLVDRLKGQHRTSSRIEMPGTFRTHLTINRQLDDYIMELWVIWQDEDENQKAISDIYEFVVPGIDQGV